MAADSRACSTVERSSSSSTSTSSGRWNGWVGASRPSTTPVIVAWMPDSSSASHNAAPSTVMTTIERTPASRHTMTTPTRPTRDGRRPRLDAVRVEDGDDGDRSDVVDDRQRQQEQREGRVDRGAEEAEDADRHGDVGGHGDAPARGTVAAGVERGVDRGRHEHPADRGDRRQRGASRLAQLALDQFALDLQPDDEEEHRHQPVVDPLPEIEIEDVPAEVDRRAGCSTGRRRTAATASSPTPARRAPRRAARRRRRPRCAGSRAAGAGRPGAPAGRHARPTRRSRADGLQADVRGGASGSMNPSSRLASASRSVRCVASRRGRWRTVSVTAPSARVVVDHVAAIEPSTSAVPCTRSTPAPSAPASSGDVAAAVGVREQRVVVLGEEAHRRGRVRVGERCVGHVDQLATALVAERAQPGSQPFDDLAEAGQARPRGDVGREAGPNAAR